MVTRLTEDIIYASDMGLLSNQLLVPSAQDYIYLCSQRQSRGANFLDNGPVPDPDGVRDRDGQHDKCLRSGMHVVDSVQGYHTAQYLDARVRTVVYLVLSCIIYSAIFWTCVDDALFPGHS